MDVFISLKLFCCVCVVVVLLPKLSIADSFPSAKCSLLSPEIRFPFRIRGLQPHQYGLAAEFSLFCRENRTVIHFPTYGDLFVKSISYDQRKLSLVDPKSCVHEVFLNLNLSLTPFSYYYVVQQYKYINCSAKLVGSFEQVPCLSGSNHHVYIVEPSFLVPVSCSIVKTVAIPFSYSPYLSDSSFGLGLTWNSTRIDDEEAKSGCKPGILCETGHTGKYFRALYVVPGIIVAILIVAKLMYASLSRFHKEFNEEKIKETLGEVEIDKLLGEYEAFESCKVVIP